MGRTFNRPPLTVNTPSSSDVKQYFFNHYNWKGVDNNKNFLAVDQETFADSQNVYVNEEGVLRSRPSLKIKTSINGDVSLSDVTNLFVYGKLVLSSFSFTKVNHVSSFTFDSYTTNFP